MSLNIAVCLKAVPDPSKSSDVTINPDTGTLQRSRVKLVINQLDKHALEAGLQLKEQFEGNVTVISMGPPEAEECLKEALALGADKAYLLCDRKFAGADAHATAFTLASAIKKIGTFDLVFCGNESSDGSTAQVGPRMAELLDLSLATAVFEISPNNSKPWEIRSKIEYGHRIISLGLPALITVTKDINTPRTMSFSGILSARKKQVVFWGIKDLEISEEKVGQKGSPTIMSNWQPSIKKRKGEIISGDKEQVIKTLIQKLSESGVL